MLVPARSPAVTSSSCGAPRLLPLASLPPPGRSRPEQICAHHTHRGNDEEPEDGEERQPDQGEGKRIHLVICPRWPMLPLLVPGPFLFLGACLLQAPGRRMV